MAKKTVKDYLDSLVDEQGLKSEVTVTLTDRTLIRTAVTLFGTATAITLMVLMVRGIVRNAETN